MTFIPPGFSALRVNTLNLDTQFSTKLGRYKIVDSSAEASSSASKKIQSSLEILIIRTQKVITCKSDKLSEIAVFNKLVNELNEIVKAEKKEQYSRATLFLLGALLHRYFRLLNSYDNFNGFTYFKTSDVRNCRLFNTIRMALQLPSDTSGNYRKQDLEILDVTTIVTALEVFRDNMKAKDVDRVQRYKKYPHFAADKNFETYLQDIIDEHKKRGEPVLKQFRAINFIQSLAKKVENECQQVEEELVKWSKILQKERTDFSAMTVDDIDQHIVANIKSVPLREKIRDLLFTPQITDNLEMMAHETFVDSMKKCQTDRAAYTVFGGYALLLQSPGIEQLKFCLYQALGIEEKQSAVTDKDMLFGINHFLKPFLEDNPDIVLDYQFFGGKEKLDTFMTKKIEALVASTNEKSEEVKDQVFVLI